MSFGFDYYTNVDFPLITTNTQNTVFLPLTLQSFYISPVSLPYLAMKLYLRGKHCAKNRGLIYHPCSLRAGKPRYGHRRTRQNPNPTARNVYVVGAIVQFFQFRRNGHASNHSFDPCFLPRCANYFRCALFDAARGVQREQRRRDNYGQAAPGRTADEFPA